MVEMLKKDYEFEKACERLYDEAEKNGNELMMEAASKAHRAFETEAREKGNDYCALYRMYCEARNSGNELIDVNEPYQYNDASNLIHTFRKYRVEQFTFSSSWSGATEAAWRFAEMGCDLLGMVEINSKYSPSFGKKEREKVHAYLFKVN